MERAGNDALLFFRPFATLRTLVVNWSKIARLAGADRLLLRHPRGEDWREKRIKKWNRAWKLRLIEEANPDWRDLATDLGFGSPAFAGDDE